MPGAAQNFVRLVRQRVGHKTHRDTVYMPDGRAVTANGTVATAPVRIDRLEFGPIMLRNVAASVTDGSFDGSLLGMRFLSRFGRIEIEEVPLEQAREIDTMADLTLVRAVAAAGGQPTVRKLSSESSS